MGLQRKRALGIAGTETQHEIAGSKAQLHCSKARAGKTVVRYFDDQRLVGSKAQTVTTGDCYETQRPGGSKAQNVATATERQLKQTSDCSKASQNDLVETKSHLLEKENQIGKPIELTKFFC